ncbi:MAG TPA: ribbon-helix-helix protein, CopG family [Chloroflexi bacterium]|nr:ribbon-helix-helix protein, CopG family [Chloroflexota bacterium]
MPLTKRVMVLFDADRYKKLDEEAKQRHCSKGALIREAVEKGILQKGEASKSERIEAARRLISMEEDIPDWDEMEKLIAREHLNE